jgi:hypothetical protein
VPECVAAALWAAGLCGLALASVRLVMLPSDREGGSAGLAAGIGFGMCVIAVWHAWMACRVW